MTTEQITKSVTLTNGAQCQISFVLTDGGTSEVNVECTLTSGGETAKLQRTYWRDMSHKPAGTSIVFNDAEIINEVSAVFNKYPDVPQNELNSENA